MPDTDALLRNALDAVWGPLDPPAEGWGPDGERLVRRQLLDAASLELNRAMPSISDRSQALGLAGVVADLSTYLDRGFKFLPGEVRKTPGLSDLSVEAANGLLQRHLAGDWGDVTDDDRKANEVALAGGGRLLSVYKDVHDGAAFWTKVWVMTDADAFQDEGSLNRMRMNTLLMLPSEY